MDNNIDKLVDLMLNANRLIREGSKSGHSRHCLSIIQLRILLRIEEQGKSSMKDIAGYLGVTAPTASVMINTLEKDHFIIRQADKDDRRLTYIKIASAGRKKSQDAMEHIKARISFLFEKLTLKEQEQFIGLLKKILLTEYK